MACDNRTCALGSGSVLIPVMRQEEDDAGGAMNVSIEANLLRQNPQYCWPFGRCVSDEHEGPI